MFVMKLTAVLNDRCGTTPESPLGLNGSEPCRRCRKYTKRNDTRLKREQRVGVHGPALLALLVDAAGAIDQPLDREEDAVTGGSSVAVHAGHVAAE